MQKLCAVYEVGTDLSDALEINFFRPHLSLVLDECIYDNYFISNTVTALQKFNDE
jgi:hypothetical protein